MPRRSALALLLVGLGLGGWLAPSPAEAASVKSVQTGTTSISGPTNTVTVSITSVDTAKSFLVFQTRHNSNRPVASYLSGRLATATSLEFVKVSDESAGAGVVNIRWYVVEFEGGVRVQRGEVSQSATTINVGITAVASLSQAFVTWSKTPFSGDGSWGTDDPVVCELTTTSNLQCRVNATNADHVIRWQVVEFTDPAIVNVQKGSTSLIGTALSTTATLGTAVDVSKTFVLASYRTAGGGADVGANMLRAQLTGSTTISFDRDISGSPDDLTEITWQAVELKDGSSVQRGSANFASASAQASASISSVDTSRSVAFASVQPVGGQNMGKSPYAGDDIIGVGSATLALSSTQITLDRDSTVAAADIGWFVVQFFKCAAVADASYVAANAQPGQAIVYWSSTPNPALILRKTAPFAGEAPTNGVPYAVNDPIGAATVVYNGSAGATSFTQTSLTNGTAYYYKVFAKTGTGGASCYAPGIEVNAWPEAGPTPDWSYMMAGGAVLKAGIASWTGTIYTSSNANRIISLSTTNPKGTQSWEPLATSAPIQGWLTWASVGSGGIKSVQSGTATMSTTTQTAAITTVDPAKSFVVCSSRTGSSNASQRVTCELTGSGSTVTITSNEANAAQYVRWYVAEFKGGVSVQRGVQAFSTSDTILNVPISAVQLSKSFVLTSERTTTTSQTLDDQWTMRAQLTSTTNLELSRYSNATPAAATVAWQVIQMSAATVQRGLITLLAGESSKTQGISAVTLANSFLLFTRRGSASGGTETQYQVRGELTNGTTLTFSRDSTLNTVDIAWEVLGLSDGSTVQRGTAAAFTTETLLSPGISVTPSRSVPFISVQGGVDATSDLDSTSWTATVAASNLNLERASAQSVDANISWQVVQFATTGGAPVVWGGDQNGRVYSVDPTLGVTNWTLDLTSQGIDRIQAGIAGQVRAWSDSAYQTNPLVGGDDTIFVASRNSATAQPTRDNKVFGVRASDGTVLWTFQDAVNGVDFIVGMPAADYARNWLYVASRAGAGGQPSLWILSTLDGSVVKSFALGHLDTSPSPSYDGNTLYVANTAGQLYAIDLTPATPALKWTGPMALGSAINGFVWEDGALATYLYFSTADGNVWCIRDPGVSQPPPSTPPLSPQASCPWKNLVNGTGVSNLLPLDAPYTGLYVGGADGTLRRLNPTSGAIETTVTVGDGTKIVGDLSTETGSEVFVPTSEGKIYKFPLPLP